MEAVVEQAGKDLSAVVPDLVNKVSRAAGRIFGCWHVNMSRPFSRGNETYRTCVALGAGSIWSSGKWSGPFTTQSVILVCMPGRAERRLRWDAKNEFRGIVERATCHCN